MSTQEIKRTFIIKHRETGEFIGIVEGETGYRSTTIYTQEHADELNRRNGHTAAQLQAAEACSMFGNWQNFDSLTKTIEKGAR